MCGNSLTRKTAIVKKKNKQTKSKTEKETLEEKSDKILLTNPLATASVGNKTVTIYGRVGRNSCSLPLPEVSVHPLQRQHVFLKQACY